MTLKNLFLLTGVLAGAAYFRDKGRRDRFVGKANDLLDRAKTRASSLATKVESKAAELTDHISDRASSASTTSGTSSYDGSGDNGYSGSRTYR